MIDIEQAVFTIVRDAVKTKYPNALVLGEYTREIQTFPCVMLTEINNIVNKQTQDDIRVENHCIVGYQVDVICTGTNKKKQSKEIIKEVDTALASKLFIRDFLQSLNDFEDIQLYRITARYSAVVGNDYRMYTN